MTSDIFLRRELAPESVGARPRSHTDYWQKDRPKYRVDLGISLSFIFGVTLLHSGAVPQKSAVFDPCSPTLELWLVPDITLHCFELSGDFCYFDRIRVFFFSLPLYLHSPDH